ncbi:MAG TPA: methyltransferase domain-containing protein [Cyclobacteriaceae bacterium]|nr:methyltransferase domain-containing protein [Cyclobacteriaceae bacterium]
MILPEEIDDFFRRKLQDFGPSAEGMGWRDRQAQWIRFRQLIKVIEPTGSFSINDVGCGSGDLIQLLQEEFPDRYLYTGYDALPEMVAAARKQYPIASVTFRSLTSYDEIQEADYAVASGIFNVRNSSSDETWLSYILTTLHAMNESSTRGFAFNALTSYSDHDRMRPELYYADPLFLFDYCKKNFSRNVALLHDYGIFDFTILVRKVVAA